VFEIVCSANSGIFFLFFFIFSFLRLVFFDFAQVTGSKWCMTRTSTKEVLPYEPEIEKQL